MQKEIYEKVLEVPYHSQFLEVENSFWNIRSCGGACIKMICDYHDVPAESILEIMEYAENNGGYNMDNGFVHDFAVNYFKKRGLYSERVDLGFLTLDDEAKREDNFSKIIENINEENPVMVSIVKHTLEQTKYHLVLIVGYKYFLIDENLGDKAGNRKITSITYHEPESTTEERGQYRECSIETFYRAWLGKAIFAS